MHHEWLLDVVGSSISVCLLCLFPLDVVVRGCISFLICGQKGRWHWGRFLGFWIWRGCGGGFFVAEGEGLCVLEPGSLFRFWLGVYE